MGSDSDTSAFPRRDLPGAYAAGSRHRRARRWRNVAELISSTLRGGAELAASRGAESPRTGVRLPVGRFSPNPHARNLVRDRSEVLLVRTRCSDAPAIRSRTKRCSKSNIINKRLGELHRRGPGRRHTPDKIIKKKNVNRHFFFPIFYVIIEEVACSS